MVIWMNTNLPKNQKRVKIVDNLVIEDWLLKIED